LTAILINLIQNKWITIMKDSIFWRICTNENFIKKTRLVELLRKF